MKMLNMLASNLAGLDFPMFAYLPRTGKMYRLDGGKTSPMPVPETIRPGLEDESKSVIYFRKGDEIIVFFFFRIQAEGSEIILVIQDSKGGQRPARVLSVFASKALTEQAAPAPEPVFRNYAADDALRRELERMIGRVTELEISLSEKDAKLLELQRRLFVQNELLERMESADSKDETRIEEIMELKEQIVAKNEEIANLEAEIQSLHIEAESLSSKLGSYDDVLSDNDVKIHELEAELETQSEELVKAEDLIGIIKTSRNKIRKLMDGLPMPLFSVDKHYIVKNVNRAAGDFAGNGPLNEIVGQECYKVFYGFDAPCSWCRLSEALEGKETTEHIDVYKKDKLLKIEQQMYPVHNNEGEVDEAGEHLFDMTEQYELINSLETYRGQIKKYKMSKLNDINEIEELKKEYATLNESYEELQTKFQKMRVTLERLLSEDKMNELLRTRNENAELRNKLTRAASALRNYQVNLDDSKTRYTELNKKTVYQLERLINVLNNKATLKQPDMEQSFAFINSELARLKRDYDKLCGGKTAKTSVNVSDASEGAPDAD